MSRTYSHSRKTVAAVAVLAGAASVHFAFAAIPKPPALPAAALLAMPAPGAFAQGSFTQSLRAGASGDQVKMLQNRLASEGYFSGEATGYFGPLTLEAVKKFQAKYGISAIGIVGPLTLAQLNAGSNGSVPPPPSVPVPGNVGGTSYSGFTFAKALSSGASGEDVVQLQTRLAADGVYGGPITGFFGPMTKIAVMSFQAKHGLDQVGIVGPKTLLQLNAGGYGSATVPPVPAPTPEAPSANAAAAILATPPPVPDAPDED